MKTETKLDVTKIRTDIYNNANPETRAFLTQNNGKIKDLQGEIQSFSNKTAGKSAQSIHVWAASHGNELPSLIASLKSSRTHEALIEALDRLPTEAEIHDLEAKKKNGELSKEENDTLIEQKKQRKKLSTQVHRQAWISFLMSTVNKEEIWLYFTLKTLEAKEIKEITEEQLEGLKAEYQSSPNAIPKISDLKRQLKTNKVAAEKTSSVKKIVQSRTSKKSKTVPATEAVLKTLTQPKDEKTVEKKEKKVAKKKTPVKVAKTPKKEVGTTYRVLLPAPIMAAPPSDCKKIAAMPLDEEAQETILNQFADHGEFQMVLCKENLGFQDGGFVVQTYLLQEHIGAQRFLDKLQNRDQLVCYNIQGHGFQKGTKAIIQRTMLQVQGPNDNISFHRDEKTYDGETYQQSLKSWRYSWIEGVLRNDHKIALEGMLRVATNANVTIVSGDQLQVLASFTSLFEGEEDFYFANVYMDNGIVTSITAFT